MLTKLTCNFVSRHAAAVVFTLEGKSFHFTYILLSPPIRLIYSFLPTNVKHLNL